MAFVAVRVINMMNSKTMYHIKLPLQVYVTYFDFCILLSVGDYYGAYYGDYYGDSDDEYDNYSGRKFKFIIIQH